MLRPSTAYTHSSLRNSAERRERWLRTVDLYEMHQDFIHQTGPYLLPVNDQCMHTCAANSRLVIFSESWSSLLGLVDSQGFLRSDAGVLVLVVGLLGFSYGQLRLVNVITGND